jgi:starch phosphorylase
MARPIRDLVAKSLGSDWELEAEPAAVAAAVREMEDDRLWAAHDSLRQLLFHYIREEARTRWREKWKDPTKLAGSGVLLSPSILTIGFARRFATYKRADLLLRDRERLRRLLTNPSRPVQIIFSGKAHPADDPGKRVLQQVFMAAQDPSFEGRIAFLEDYEVHLAHRLVAGVDLWLNLPRVPLEACGTSGMKAALNGVPSLSVLDGWWIEGHIEGATGWAIGDDSENSDAAREAISLYDKLEQEVLPLFYKRPAAFGEVMRNCIAFNGSFFNTQRMMLQYARNIYTRRQEGAVS